MYFAMVRGPNGAFALENALRTSAIHLLFLRPKSSFGRVDFRSTFHEVHEVHVAACPTPLHWRCLNIVIIIVRVCHCALLSVIVIPNEDFGRPNKHFRTHCYPSQTKIWEG